MLVFYAMLLKNEIKKCHLSSYLKDKWRDGYAMLIGRLEKHSSNNAPYISPKRR